MGARSVVITGGDARPRPAPPAPLRGLAPHPHAQGWLTAPRPTTPTHTWQRLHLRLSHGGRPGLPACRSRCRRVGAHGDTPRPGQRTQGRTRARACAGAARLGRHPWAPGAPLPWLGIGSRWPLATDPVAHPCATLPTFTPPTDGLYGIVSTADQLEAALKLGLRCIQLRHKPVATLAEHHPASQQAAREHGALLFVNDHWESAWRAPPLRTTDCTWGRKTC